MTQKRNKKTKASRDNNVESGLTPDQLADCRTFARLYDERKEQTRGLENEPTLNFVRLEELTGISQTTWGNYTRAERPIAATAMAWIEEIYAYPKENFKGWPRTSTPVRNASMLAAVGQLQYGERSALTELVRQLAKAPKDRRAKIIATMSRMLGASGKIALAKTSSG